MSMATVYTWGGDVQSGGAWLRRLRESQGMNQRELAARTGGRVSFPNISQLEIGGISKPSMGMLVALGETLGVEPNEIAQRFGWWTPRDRERSVEPEQIVFLKNVLERLSPGQRYSLLQSIETLARVAEQQQHERQREA